MSNPTEVWPSSAAVDSLDGTTDSPTGLPYIAKGTSPASVPDLAEQYQRRENRQNAILATVNTGRIVKTANNKVGAFAGRFRIGTTNMTYSGETECVNYTAAAVSDDDYYLYFTSASDAGADDEVQVDTAWPSDKGTFIPLAIVTVVSGAITQIVDCRGEVLFWARSGGTASATGTDEVDFILDEDNAGGAEAETQLRFRRGTAGNDVALRHPTGSTKLQVIADEGANTFGNLEANQLVSKVSTGTKPIDVTSTTACDNLNADQVDGVDISNPPAAAGGIAYADGTTSMDFTAAGSSGEVLVSDGASVPLWKSLVLAGIQAVNDLLTAIAGLGANGIVCRTSSSGASARTITAGTGISVTNGDGVSGNPTIAVGGMTNHGVPIGTAAGALATLAVASSNTVLAGNSGADPAFRQIVNADINTTAAIDPAKLAAAADEGYVLVSQSGSGAFANAQMNGHAMIDGAGVINIFEPAAPLAAGEVANVIKVVTSVYRGDLQLPSKKALLNIWLSDDTTGALTGTAADAVAISGGVGIILETVVSNKHYRVLTDLATGRVDLDITKSGSKNYYLFVEYLGYVTYSNQLQFT